jgi:mRNA interferase HigB
MRVISKSRLKQFWKMPGRKDAQGPLRAWYAHVNSKTVSWRSWGDVKTHFGTASLIGNCVVFNIAGNKYRLVVRILYRSPKVFILRVMTHEQYDKENWKEECGCFAALPKGAKKPEKPTTDRSKKRKRG